MSGSVGNHNKKAATEWYVEPTQRLWGTMQCCQRRGRIAAEKWWKQELTLPSSHKGGALNGLELGWIEAMPRQTLEARSHVMMSHSHVIVRNAGWFDNPAANGGHGVSAFLIIGPVWINKQHYQKKKRRV
jgi:hypothetical protein